MYLYDFYFEPLHRIVFRHLEELFIDLYLDWCYESKPLLDTTIILYAIISIKYKKVNILKTMNKQYQHLLVMK